MAFVSLIPTSLSASVNVSQAQGFVSGIVTNQSGAAIDLSTWTALAAHLVPTTPGPASAAVAKGTVTGNSNGTLSVNYAAADTASLSPGSCNLIIIGKPTSGDDSQVLSRGTFTLTQDG